MTLDAVIVNVALPDIRRDLAGGMSGLQWVVDGYTLMFAALLLSGGSLSDRAGARRAFGAGLVVFVRDLQVRRTVLAHAILSYMFGVVIIAGSVNLISGLFH